MRDATGPVLTLGGQAFSGWKSMRIERGLQQCAGGFELGVSELPRGAGAGLVVGEACSVLLDGQAVVTGYVDVISTDIAADTHALSIAGRDKTADLVDCSAVRSPGQWQGQRVEQIAAELARPFGITVLVDAGVSTGKPLASFALQEGETVFCALERAARMRGLLLTSDGQGSLLITRAGHARVSTVLELGVNVLAVRTQLDWRDRFSSYTVKGQTSGLAWDGPGAQARAAVAASAAGVVARATDPGINRHRPLVLVGECQDGAATFKDRVLWEASVRAARSLEVDVTVQGWTHADGLWQPNRIARLVVPTAGLADDVLITQVNFALDERGTTTTLRATRPDAFRVLPLAEATSSTVLAFQRPAGAK